MSSILRLSTAIACESMPASRGGAGCWILARGIGWRIEAVGGERVCGSPPSSYLSLALVCSQGVGPADASSTTTAVQASAGPPNSAAYNWVELHRDSSLSGYASNSSLNISNVGSLGVRWAASMYGPALTSPVVSTTSLGMMTYVGTDAGYVLAFKAGTAQLVWGRPLGGNIIASPVVADGALWIATETPAKLYKLDLTTGATECSLVTSHEFYSSFTAATPPGGKPSIYVSNLDNGTSSGPMMGIEASNCSVEWSFSAYHTPPNGPWAPIAYGVDKKGTPLVLDGTSDPDQSEYAVNALTGKLVWRFQGPGDGDYDIAAGAEISAPGVNGFADGVAYVPTKFGQIFALNLTTGAKIWSYTFNPRPPLTTSATGRSTPALDGTNLVFGYHSGVMDLNAVNGKLRWNYKDPSGTEVLSSVAIVGKTQAAVICADLSGAVHALNIANGDSLYNYQTGGYIVSSPAVSDGDVLIASSDGLLYDFAVGGGNDTTLPTASTTSPSYGSSVANPNGSEVISGTATDPVGVSSVDVSIESGGVGGTWWDGATGKWRTGPFPNPVTLATPDGTTTDWSYHLPVPTSGGSYLVSVITNSSGGQASTGSDQLEFSVQKSTAGPQFEASQYDVAGGRGGHRQRQWLHRRRDRCHQPPGADPDIGKSRRYRELWPHRCHLARICGIRSLLSSGDGSHLQGRSCSTDLYRQFMGGPRQRSESQRIRVRRCQLQQHLLRRSG